MFGLGTGQKGSVILSAKERMEHLVTLLGGDTSEIYRTYYGNYHYHAAKGELDIRISNSDAIERPWVDIYHFGVGPIALFCIEDDGRAARLIKEYQEVFDDPGVPD